MLYLGIDPGRKGSMFASYNGIMQHIDFNGASDMDLYMFLLQLKIKHGDNYICGLERVNAMLNDGIVQAFSFGRQLQRIITLLSLVGMVYVSVEPRKWQNYLAYGKLPKGKHNYESRKKKLYEIAKEMTDYKGLNKDNCDAYLITKYIEMTNKTKTTKTTTTTKETKQCRC